jgi:hypothetical protein
LGELGRFLQNFKKSGVNYSFDSTSGTAQFQISSEVEVGNVLQKRLRAQQLDDEDALLLGLPNLSEDSMVMYSDRTAELWSIADTNKKYDILREQEDMDLLGISDNEINILS